MLERKSNLLLMVSLLFLFIAIGCGSSGDGGGENLPSNPSQTSDGSNSDNSNNNNTNDGHQTIQTTVVSGTVVDLNAAPIEGAEVAISSDPVSVMTDIDGYFEATIEVGDHHISIKVGSEEIYSDDFNCTEEPYNFATITTQYDPHTTYPDADGDGHYSNLDCDDNNANVYPGATEKCDGKDNNCDGSKDEECDCIDGSTRTCGDNTGECSTGTQTCVNGKWSGCSGEVVPANEICDGKDNNCDGSTDENGCECIDGSTRTCGDNTGECSKGTETCVNGTWSGCSGEVVAAIETCDGKDNNCDGNTDEGVTNACGFCGAVPTETCDGIDNDCDGSIDEGVDCECIDGATKTCGDNIGECSTGTQTCVNGKWNDCSAEVVPASEICDGKDNDCDGQIDETFTNLGNSCSEGKGECKATGMRVCNSSGTGTTCNATAGSPKPEICDGKDNDCDGITDEGLKNTYYRDDDDDGYGNSDYPEKFCLQPSGWSSKKSDCDDGNGSIHPGTKEVCDGIDNNCDGNTDETGNDLCDNGDYCDGQEWCTEFGCERADPENLPCSDGETCNESTDTCKVNVKTVFATSTVWKGNLAGIAGADLICNISADNAGLTGSYKAWISDDLNSPSTTFTQSAGPYALTTGTTIADDWDDLTDGRLDHAINRTEYGDQILLGTETYVWTDTEGEDGFAGKGGFNSCDNWTSDSSDEYAFVGNVLKRTYGDWSMVSTAAYSTYEVRTCDIKLRLYCFEQ